MPFLRLPDDVTFANTILAATLDASGEGLLATDSQGNVVIASRKFREIWHLDEAEITDSPFADMAEQCSSPKDFRDFIASHQQTGIAGSQLFQLRNGTSVEVSCQFPPLGNGERLGLWTFKDVTSNNDAEVLGAKLAAVVESSDDAIISKTLEGVITSWNKGAERIFGYETSEIVGKSVLTLIPEERHHEEPVILKKLRSGERIEHFETQRTTKDGRLLDISLTVSPIKDPSGNVVGISKIARDITERKRIEHTRLQLLESERKARLEAERLGRIKDEFLATLSHELRTPLNAIIGWTHILRKYASDPTTVSEGVEVIERNAKLQTQLVGDLLDMSRIISGKMLLEKHPVQLVEQVQAAIDVIRPAADGKSITIHLHAGRTPDLIMADPARIQQVFWNLLSNAVKFTPAGGSVDITVTSRNSLVNVAFKDSGKGIRPEFIPHLFERFSQQDSSASRQHGGLGLGLALVKQIVDLHGGSVMASSEGDNTGATFTVTLPTGTVDTTNATFSGDSTNPFDLPVLDVLDGATVLVVDDEADARDLLRRILEDSGARVITAESAERALSAMSPDIDLIISDIGMPGRDGYALIRDIRAAGHLTPAVALTAFARPSDREYALASGYQSHIGKPVDPNELLSAIAAIRQTPSSEKV